jgi:hypothetical protein
VRRAVACLTLALALAACGPRQPPLGPEDRAAVAAGVRDYARTVAEDLAREGPLAWRRHFSAAPEFFMANDGELAFADGPAAQRGVAALPQSIRAIELRWGDDLRVDPLTRDLAVMGSSWSETLTDPQGRASRARGYFTALLERRDGRWRFRDAHWSSRRPDAPP